jgi:hypothetical protein
MVCDNVLVIDTDMYDSELVSKIGRECRIWNTEQHGNKTIVHFSSSNIPNINNIALVPELTLSYYLEEGAFVCIGYFSVKGGNLEKNVSWNNKDVGSCSENGLTYAKKFISQIYPHKTSQIFVM